jgi:maltooligosyltrehalose trehalohydrolase
VSGSLGARPLPDGRTRFTLWAPFAQQLELCVGERRLVMNPQEGGLHVLEVEDAPVGSRYAFCLDGGTERPDPASRRQPEGVHARSAVTAETYPWLNDAVGLSMEGAVVYELHVGTFTPGRTFESAAEKLSDLKALGVTAVELMPVAAFPGDRNWGYDGVLPSAALEAYGGPDGFRGFVDACHGAGLAVILDVVYNHLGPEGNYLREFGPYFTDEYRTPWGPALNFDGAHSDSVRRYFIESALWWLDDCKVDGLRLDAVHEIKDGSAYPFLRELADAVDRLEATSGRSIALIGESDRNDPRYLDRGPSGLGLDGMWADDLHHALHALVTGERQGYYEDFGTLEDVARAWTEGASYQGRWSPFRKRRHGRTLNARPDSLVVEIQNHDQIGNRMMGERLPALVGHETHGVCLSLVMLSPWVPLLFMGEEYGEDRPFQFFISHGDPGLVESVREGRKAEFKSFHWKGAPPDPQDEATFRASSLAPDEVSAERRERSRRRIQQLAGWRAKLDRARGSAEPIGPRVLRVDWPEVFGIANFGDDLVRPEGPGRLLFDSDGHHEEPYTVPPRRFRLYERL